jgi:hypothetical protein
MERKERRTDARPQRRLVLDRGCRQSLRALLRHEAANLAVPLALRPDDEDVCDGTMEDELSASLKAYVSRELRTHC